jgi:SRSO17 transposase
VTRAQHRSVQRPQFFLSESRWDPDRVNARRLKLLRAAPATAPHEGGVLVIDDSGDRKDGVKTAHIGRQWLGRYGKTDNGVVTVTTVWADERMYYPVQAMPYTPPGTARRARTTWRSGPSCRSAQAWPSGRGRRFTFRAVVADSAYGDQDGFRAELAEAGLPFVMALRPRWGTWARAADAHTPVEVPGRWRGVARMIRVTGAW